MKPQSSEKATYDCVYTLNNAKKHKTYSDGYLYCTGNRVALHSHVDAPIDKCVHPRAPNFKDEDDITVGRYLVIVGDRQATSNTNNALPQLPTNIYPYSQSTGSLQNKVSQSLPQPRSLAQLNPTPTLIPSHHQPQSSLNTSTNSTSLYSHPTYQSRQSLSPTPTSFTAKSSHTSTFQKPVPKGSIKTPTAPTPSYAPLPRTQPIPQPQSAPTEYKPPQGILTLRESPHIYVSAHLNSFLRPHQRDGVKFSFNCILGTTIPSQHGALIMDDVGLGKTLQSIALIDSMLSYPYIRSKKVIICCPTILTTMWHRECNKWLSPFSFLYTLVSPDKTNQSHIQSFISSTRPHILIISYEQIRKYIDDLKQCKNVLLICDEAHRLKSNAETKTIAALATIQTKLKLLLTATPIQNDLQEFYAMANFAVPGYLAPDLSSFTNNYVKPIIAMQDPRNTAKEMIQRLGNQRNNELMDKIAKFCLRRTHETIGKFLPPKTNLLLFLHPTPLQVQITNIIIELHKSQPSVYQILPVLNLLRKCATSPYLLIFNALTKTTTPSASSQTANQFQNGKKGSNNNNHNNDDGVELTTTQAIISKLSPYLPRCSLPQMISSSSKISLLHKLIELYSPYTNIIIISSFTETLKYIQSTLLNHSCLSLDGSTDSKTRISTIETFNNKQLNITSKKHHILFLSAKAAGAGLNLINGCVQISLDSNWNPAIDTQAQGRMWRSGQTQHVMAFQLITNGSIDEHVLLRQIAKNDIASSLLQKRAVDRGNDSNTKSNDNGVMAVANSPATTLNRFSPDELRRVLNFEYHKCMTYDMLSGNSDKIVDDYDHVDNPTNLLSKPAKRHMTHAADEYNQINNSRNYNLDSDEDEIVIKIATQKAHCDKLTAKPIKRSKHTVDTSSSSNDDNLCSDDNGNSADDDDDNKSGCENSNIINSQTPATPTPNSIDNHKLPSNMITQTSNNSNNHDKNNDWFDSSSPKQPLPPPPTLPPLNDSNVNVSSLGIVNNVFIGSTPINTEMQQIRGGYVYYSQSDLIGLVELTLPVLTTSPTACHKLQQAQSQQPTNNSASSIIIDEDSPLFQQFVALGTGIYTSNPRSALNSSKPSQTGTIFYALVRQTNFDDDFDNDNFSTEAHNDTNCSSLASNTFTSSDSNTACQPPQFTALNPLQPPINTAHLLHEFTSPQVTSTLLKRSIFESSSDEE